MKQKIWHIEIHGQREGPFSFDDLKRDFRITPDTLVWRKGFTCWKPIRDVPELKDLFKDESAPDKDTQEIANFKPKSVGDEELTLALGQEPPYLFWILALLILLVYLFSRLYL